MNKKLEFFSSMAVAFIVLILVFLCIRFSGQGKFATHGGTNPSDVKCIYTSVWPAIISGLLKSSGAESAGAFLASVLDLKTGRGLLNCPLCSPAGRSRSNYPPQAQRT